MLPNLCLGMRDVTTQCIHAPQDHIAHGQPGVTDAQHPEDIYGDLYTEEGEGEGLLHIQNSEVGA